MGIDNNIGGNVRFRLTSGDLSRTLQELAKSNLTVHEVVMESELSALVSLSVGEYRKAWKIIKRNGGQTELIKRQGLLWMMYGLRKRAVLLTGCLILLALTIWLPSRIFFLDVTGNQLLPDNYIKMQAQMQGMSFGCKRSEVRSEIMKNRLLAEIPELEWVGITTSGCVATISVRESQTRNHKNESESVPGNVIAVCDGVISSVTVTKGNPVCKPGQAVQKGQILISGYEDCGLILKHTGAEGEVYANTYRILEGFSLLSADKRTDLKSVTKKISIRIGKNLIKLSKDSGISYTSCVKMYSERYVTLPGGFQLPVSFVVETFYDYESSSIISDHAYDWLNVAVESYLQNQMFAGTVLNNNLQLNVRDEICFFRGQYSCIEQIGVNKIEEILSYGKNG